MIEKQYALGQTLAIPGTPVIVLGDATSPGGYVVPDKLIAVLEEYAKEQSQAPVANLKSSDSRPASDRRNESL